MLIIKIFVGLEACFEIALNTVIEIRFDGLGLAFLADGAHTDLIGDHVLRSCLCGDAFSLCLLVGGLDIAGQGQDTLG